MREGKGEFLFWEAERGAKEGWPAPGEGHEAHTFFEVAIAGQQFQSCLDEGLRIQGNQVGLVLVDALVVNGIDSASFTPMSGEYVYSIWALPWLR